MMNTIPEDVDLDDYYEDRQRPEQRQPQRAVQMRTAGNRFELDLSKKPPHMTYNWKRFSILGMEDVEHMINLEANGWTCVPAARHREVSGRHADGKANIIRGGEVLMECPTEFVQEAEELDGFAARNQVHSQLRRLGLVARGHGKGVRTSIVRPDED
jgi:hypothetical protein